MPTDDQPHRIGPFSKIREWIIGSQADSSAEDTPVPPRPAGLDTRLPAAMAAELRAADPASREALQILFKVEESIGEEFKAIDPDWSHPEVLSRPRRIYHAVNGLEVEVNNGGFEQYYINSSSHCAHELPGMLRDIGMPELADLVARANAVFPADPPANRAVRLAMVDKLGKGAMKKWDRMTREYFKKNYTCQPHLARHILAHEADFFKG